MIQPNVKQAVVLSDGETQETIKMGIDLSDTQWIMQILSKDLYSDPIGSTVREWASNALDSHRRAGVSKPIIVSLGVNDQGNYEFSVEDFGVGLDDDDVTNIISKYGKSTKRETNLELGLFGLGFKVGLSYSSSFYFVCRKDGIERKYMMYEGEEGNSIDLLYENKTTESNGVKMIIPVKVRDVGSFTGQIKTQLAYFEDVYFDVHAYGSLINNDFFILRSDDFQLSELTTYTYMHLTLDNVSYPIDYEALKIPRINCPIALRFNLSDGISPVPNRESIKYTPEVKSLIMDKITKVADFLVTRYNESVTESDDIKAIIQYYSRSQSKYAKLTDERSVCIDDILKYTKVKVSKPTLKGVKILDIQKISEQKEDLFNEYSIIYKIDRDRMSSYKKSKYHYHNDSYNILSDIFSARKVFIYSQVITATKRDYLKEKYATYSDGNFIIQKTRSFKLFGSHPGYLEKVFSYYHLLDLDKVPREKWRDAIKEIQYVQSLLTKDFVNVDDIVVPDEWLKERKKKKVSQAATNPSKPKRVKLEGDIVGKRAENLERYVSGKNCKFVPFSIPAADIHKRKTLFIYASYDDESLLDKIFFITRTQRVNLLIFSNREMKVVEQLNIHNLVSYKTFMEGKLKPFKRIVTSFLINELEQKYHNVFSNTDTLTKITTPLAEKVKTLREYRDTHYVHVHEGRKLYDGLLEIAKEHKYYDTTIYDMYLQVKEILERLTFLEPMMREMHTHGYSSYSRHTSKEDLLPIIKDLFKYYKFKMNYDCYELKLNDDVTPKEEEITEELVSESIN